MSEMMNIKLDEKTILQDLRKFRKSTTWIANNLAVIRKQYPDRYVAVYDRKIVDTGEDFDTLFGRLKKDYDMSKVTIEFVPSKEVIVVL